MMGQSYYYYYDSSYVEEGSGPHECMWSGECCGSWHPTIPITVGGVFTTLTTPQQQLQIQHSQQQHYLHHHHHQHNHQQQQQLQTQQQHAEKSVSQDLCSAEQQAKLELLQPKLEVLEPKLDQLDGARADKSILLDPLESEQQMQKQQQLERQQQLKQQVLLQQDNSKEQTAQEQEEKQQTQILEQTQPQQAVKIERNHPTKQHRSRPRHSQHHQNKQQQVGHQRQSSNQNGQSQQSQPTAAKSCDNKKLRHREVEKNRHRQLQAMVRTLSERIPGRLDKETQVQTMKRAARYCVYLRDVLGSLTSAQSQLSRAKLEEIYARSCKNVEIIMTQQKH